MRLERATINPLDALLGEEKREEPDGASVVTAMADEPASTLNDESLFVAQSVGRPIANVCRLIAVLCCALRRLRKRRRRRKLAGGQKKSCFRFLSMAFVAVVALATT